MTLRIPGLAGVLLLTLCAGPVQADDPAPLPDISSALQSWIDGRMSEVLNGSTETHRATASPEPIESLDQGLARRAAPPSGRTDEPGWKPYHSAM